jgi:hypothetical protein
MIKIASGTSVRLLGQLGVDLTGLAVSFVFEQVNPTSSDSSGYVIGLGGSQTQTRAATVQGDPTAGLAAYTLTSSDTMVAGQYRAQFSFMDNTGTQQYFPAAGWIWFEVQEFAAPTLFSALSDFCEPVRAIMGDFRRPFKFEDGAIAGVVRTVVRCGHLGPMYGISADAMSITPPLTRPSDFSMAVYWSARTLLRPQLRGEMWGTRGLKVRRNDQRDFLMELEHLIYYGENPHQLASFQSYYSWVNSLAGINVWGLMTQMKVQGPVAEAIIGTGGIQINTT